MAPGARQPAEGTEPDAIELDEAELAPPSDAPAPLAPGDPVPLFRSDLRVGRGATAGLFEVADPSWGRSFTLYDFELSVARMLDGRRTAAAVVAAGARLGIPLDLGGLNKFLRQLWSYGFLSAPGAPPVVSEVEGGTFPPREEWAEETRALYQSGLRLMRQGRPADAAAYFEAVLDGHPANPEVSELLAQARRGLALPVRAIGEEGPPLPSSDADRPPADAPPPVPVAVSPAPAPAPMRRGVWALAAAGVLAGAVTAGALVLLRAGPGEPPAAAARPGPPPAAVAEPAPPPSPTPPSPPPPRDAAVAARAHPVTGTLRAPAAGEVSWKLADGARVEPGTPAGTLRAAVQAPVPLTAAQKRRLAELARLAQQDPVYEDFLAREQARVRRSRAVVKPVPLAAPSAGRLVRVSPERARVAEGDVLARVEDPALWRLEVSFEGAPPAPGAPCEVRGDGPEDRAPCALEAPGPEGGPVAATVRAADAPWLAGARTLSVEVRP
jgi:hypothetical protein